MVKLTGESFRFGIFLKLMVYISVTVCFSDKFFNTNLFESPTTGFSK